MIASLGMYDRAETAAANDRLWGLIRDKLRADGIAAPDALTRGGGAYWQAWESPDLLLSQTCGLPFRSRLHAKVHLVGTPDYGLPDCQPGYYRSVFVARREAPRDSLQAFDGADFAYNEGGSQSGWAAPLARFGALNLSLRPALQTGGHRLSALAVLEGKADFAALDAVTWALISAHDDWAKGLKAIGTTDQTPGLPLITAPDMPAESLFNAFAHAIDALSAADRALLHLKGITRIPASAYLAVPLPQSPEQIAQSI